ncbi:MAG: acyl-CoA thioesterase [Bacteroidales bacterium]|nr:acyl-CoA thioesterase [Muribaculaceae bacterium]MBR5532936.1 acyl-CoA thioesterase [Bacteroidales bacterium]
MDKLYKHKIEVQPRFNDFDPMGHVNNTIFMNYFDIGKVAYFKAVWNTDFIDWREIGLVIARIETDFMSPILMDERVVVRTTILRIGNKSLELSQQLINPDTNQLKAAARTIMVGFDVNTNSAEPITEKCVEAISRYEGRPFKREISK